jgi:4-oxalocrotonate tautomerase
MPIIRIEMLEGRSQEIKQKIAHEMTEVLVRNLGSDPAHIYVIFADVARSDWAVGGKFFDSPPPAQSPLAPDPTRVAP